MRKDTFILGALCLVLLNNLSKNVKNVKSISLIVDYLIWKKRFLSSSFFKKRPVGMTA
jgi:hypothetical protein